ncbi:MAG: sulfatase family protein [Blastocatellia bacterium]
MMKRLLLFTLLLVGFSPAQAQSRPNILWISAEDLSPDLSSYGDRYSRTPNLDKFAAEGARYTNAFSSAPVCAPSRSAIITGMYPTTIGSLHMRSKAVPPPGVKAFTETLRAAGYYCTNNAKTDYNFEAPPANRPPDTVWDETSRSAHWRNRPDKSQPFFAVFNHEVTHEGQVRSDDATYAKNTAALKPEDFHDPAKVTVPPYYPDTPVVRKNIARYYDLITALDYQITKLLNQLEEDGLAQNTIVFFWGDHGRGLTRGKRWVYDSGTRVPLMVRWPGKIKPGTVDDRMVSLIDLGPTVLSLAGIRPPAHMQGQAFLGEHAAKPRQYVFSHRDRMDETYDMMRAVRDNRYRYIKNFHPGRPYAQYIAYMEEMPILKEMRRLYKDNFNALSPDYGKALNETQLLYFRPEKPPEELYDLTSDPYEVKNLAASPQHQDVLKRMRAALEQWQRETKDLGLVPELELREQMRPGGVWQKVAQPVIKETAMGDAIKLAITCPTEGCSIAYMTETGKNVSWKLYAGELTLKRPATIRIKGCRFGYLDSDEVVKQLR